MRFSTHIFFILFDHIVLRVFNLTEIPVMQKLDALERMLRNIEAHLNRIDQKLDSIKNNLH
jgi:hypothetical protein